MHHFGLIFLLCAAQSTAAAENGLRVSAAAEVAVLDDDLYAGMKLGTGFVARDFDLHIELPLYLRVVDLPPADPCGSVLRCADWFADDGTIDWQRVTRILDRLDIGDQDGGTGLHIGAQYTTLGDGGLMSRYLSAPNFDTRDIGLYARYNDAAVTGELLVGHLAGPFTLAGARLALRPYAFSKTTTPLFRRAEIDVVFAADFAAPVLVTGTLTRPLMGLATTASWPILGPDAGLQVTPRLRASAMTGLSPSDDIDTALGGGAFAGLQMDMRFVPIALRFDGEVGFDTPGHRPRYFSTLYELERSSAAAAPSAGYGAARVPARGGANGMVSADVRTKELLAAGVRLSFDGAPHSAMFDAFASIKPGPFRLVGRWVQRGIDDLQIALPSSTYAVAEGSYTFFEAFTAYAKYYRTVRGSADNDIIVGLSAQGVIR